MKRILMNIASDPLPETVAAGDELEVQLSPFGDFPGLLEGQRVIQTCDRAAFERLVANFSGEILVDFEHKAEQGGDTQAAAWVQALRVDPEQGLIATALNRTVTDAILDRAFPGRPTSPSSTSRPTPPQPPPKSSTSPPKPPKPATKSPKKSSKNAPATASKPASKPPHVTQGRGLRTP